MTKSITPLQSAAETYLQALYDRGIEYVFANAGTDFAPVIEAMVTAAEQGRKIPRFFTVPHENVAVAMAHGYYLVSGKMAAAMVHVSVGTANALCSIMNASRDNAPVLLVAGRTPNTETGHAGSRNAGIHWGQESFDQGGMLREFVKWDYELRAGQHIDEIVGRALDIAMSEPRGPVYLNMPREVLAEMAHGEAKALRKRPLGASPAIPAQADIDTAAELIREARFPLILTASAGRSPENVALLAKLADDFAVAVAQPGPPGARDMNMAWDHPMFLGSHNVNALRRADVIISLDCDVPWWPKVAAPDPEAKLIHIGPDPFFSRLPLRGFEMDLAITGSVTAALQQLLQNLDSTTTRTAQEAVIQQRRQEINQLHQAMIEQHQRAMESAATARPIEPAWVAACINAARDADTIIVNELGVPVDLLALNKPKTYLSSSTAGGLGFGLGAALGAKLAAPEQHVIAIVGDGSYMFGNPTPAHFVGLAEGLPTLTIVLNNNRWNAVHMSTVAMYPEGRAAQSKSMPLVPLTPSPDFEKIMEACGGVGERVEDPAELTAAIKRGLDATRKGLPALLNVIMR
jgi:acetolactate synthase-1/2/3 large subunit